MNPQKRKYYALIVHFGQAKDTDNLLSSLIHNPDPPDGVIVIDHSKESYLCSWDVVVIRPRFNRGYAGGLNVGLGALVAKGIEENDIVVCMNNDIEITIDLFKALRQWWAEHPEDVLLGVMVNENRRVVGGGYVNLLTGRTEFSSNEIFNSHNNIWQMPYIHGSLVAAPYRVFMRCGSWPDNYFMYWEDVLLSARATYLGIPLCVAESINVRHGAAAKMSDEKLYYLVRNGALFLEREAPTRWWRSYWWLLNRWRYAYHVLRPGHNIEARALRDAISGVTGQAKKIEIKN